MIGNLRSLIFCALCMTAAASEVAGQDVATAVEVTGRAELSIDGQRFVMRSGARIPEGAEITTAEDGTVQLTFDDGTNMVMGNNSTLEVSEVLMGSGNRASRFAVNAVSGGFRFISGNSARESYEITTPTATMGVRGTEFDFSVIRNQTTLALFDGVVRMCQNGTRCAIVQGSCAIARTGGLRGVQGVTGPDAAATLLERFAFVTEQEQLRREFRASTGGCDQYFAIRSDRNPPPPRAPRPPAPQPLGGSFPGASGATGPSEGRGNEISAGQSGSGTGSGQGAENRNGRT